MKLYLAVAALMLVLLAHSEAQEEPTIEQHFANIQEKLKEFGADMTEKTASFVDQIQNHEITIKAKSWLSDQMDKVKQKIDKAFNKPE